MAFESTIICFWTGRCASCKVWTKIRTKVTGLSVLTAFLPPAPAYVTFVKVLS